MSVEPPRSVDAVQVSVVDVFVAAGALSTGALGITVSNMTAFAAEAVEMLPAASTAFTV